MKRSLLLCLLVAVNCVFGQLGTEGVHPQYVFYVHLKDRTIIKADNMGKSPEPNCVRIITRIAEGKFQTRDIPTDSIAGIKVDKRPQETPPEGAEPAPETKTILDLSTDPSRYLDKKFDIKDATLVLSTYFNFGYSDSRSTHVAFEIRDKTGRGYVYVSKEWEGAEKLRQRALRDGAIPGTFTVKILASNYSGQSAQVMAELIGYEIRKD